MGGGCVAWFAGVVGFPEESWHRVRQSYGTAERVVGWQEGPSHSGNRPGMGIVDGVLGCAWDLSWGCLIRQVHGVGATSLEFYTDGHWEESRSFHIHNTRKLYTTGWEHTTALVFSPPQNNSKSTTGHTLVMPFIFLLSLLPDIRTGGEMSGITCSCMCHLFSLSPLFRMSGGEMSGSPWPST